MSRYLNLPTLDIDFIKPRRATFDTPGSGVDSGRNGLGESVSIEFSGGGLLTCTYESCFVHDREEHEYLDWIAARLNGGFRFINVPILTDWSGPFPLDAQGVPTPIWSGIPHSDGTLFSDGAGYSQSSVWGELTNSALLNAGILSIKLYGASRPLRWSDWFSIKHPSKGWRSYRYWEVINVDNSGNAPVYTVAITPPLREAVSPQAVELGQRVEFARPRCVMKLPRGFTLKHEIEDFWVSSPTYSFVEAF